MAVYGYIRVSAIDLRSSTEKPTNIRSYANPKTSHGIFVIPRKPAFTNMKWPVFHL